MDRGLQVDEEGASSEKGGHGRLVSSSERGHPARMGACSDGFGAARPRRPTGAKLGARRSKDGLDQDDPATVKQPHAIRLSTLRLSSLFLFIVAEEHDKSVVPP